MISREHDLLHGLVHGPGWDLYRLRVAEIVKGIYQQLLDPSKARKDQASDDYLRGLIVAYRDAIEWPQQELDAYAADQAEVPDTESEGVIPLFGHGRPEPDEGETHVGTEN